MDAFVAGPDTNLIAAIKEYDRSYEHREQLQQALHDLQKGTFLKK
jgi:hypothetical protein